VLIAKGAKRKIGQTKKEEAMVVVVVRSSSGEPPDRLALIRVFRTKGITWMLVIFCLIIVFLILLRKNHHDGGYKPALDLKMKANDHTIIIMKNKDEGVVSNQKLPLSSLLSLSPQEVKIPKSSIHHHTDTLQATTTSMRTSTNNYCIWSPSDQNDCKRLIAERFHQQAASNREISTTTVPSRWLFFGDSTVAQFWQTSSLENIMVDLGAAKLNEDSCNPFRPRTCQSKHVHQQCDLNGPYGLPLPKVRQSPRTEAGEGPLLSTGYNTSCLGCKNCRSGFVVCEIPNDGSGDSNEDFVNRQKPPLSSCPRRTLHGGYFAMSFARDVVLQTPDHYTTQENILSYIHNHLLLLLLLHQPSEDTHENKRVQSICVVRAGLHDMALPNMTISKYVTNVQWFLKLLLEEECWHIVWLQNAAPRWKNDTDIPLGSPPHWCQTVERVRAYDLAVHDMIVSSVSSSDHDQTGSNVTQIDDDVSIITSLRDHVTTVDVFEASKDWTHTDNIHLSDDWNRALGMFFVKLATKVSVRS